MSARYSAAWFRRDVIAALTVAAISLPQGMAYALLAGVDPRYGLFSAILVTFVASVFGSSSHLIDGPTSAISLVVFSALSIFDPDQRIEAAEAMFLLAAIVGTVQIIITAFRLGDLTRYISEFVILGFMCAAALLLSLGQISNAPGVRDKGTGAQHILVRLWLTLTQGDAVNLRALAVSATTLVLAVLARRPVRRYRLPQFDMFGVLLLVGFAAYQLGWTVPDAEAKMAIAVSGLVPAALPSFHIPVVKPRLFLKLAPDSFAIAGLGLLEALAIAKSIAHQTRQPLDCNRRCRAERDSESEPGRHWKNPPLRLARPWARHRERIDVVHRHEVLDDQLGLASDTVNNVIYADRVGDVVDKENQPADADERQQHRDEHCQDRHEGCGVERTAGSAAMQKVKVPRKMPSVHCVGLSRTKLTRILGEN